SDHGSKSFHHLVLSRRRDAREGAPVKGIRRGENLETSLVMAEAAREFEEAFIRLGTGIAEEDLAGRQVPDNPLRQPALRLVIVEVRDVDELLRLVDEGLGDFGMRVPQRADRDAAAQVEVTAP